MRDRSPDRRSSAARRLAAAWLLPVLLLAAACGSGDEPERARSTTTERPTTTTTSSTTTTTTTLPPTTAPPPPPTVDPAAGRADATAAALRFLTASESAEVRRLCNAAQLNVRVDHPGATVRVGIVGDSLTVQTLDQIVADARFNWSVTAMCGARGDHYVGSELLGGAMNIRGAYDQVLADEPDILIVALGTNDVLDEVYTNVPRDLVPGIEGILQAAQHVPCKSWVNVHTPVRPGAPYGPEFRWDHYAPHYNQTIDAYVTAGWTGLTNWDAVVRASSPDQLLMSDGIHLSPGGRAARARLLTDAAAGLAASCVPPEPPPTEPPPTDPPPAATEPPA